MDFPPDASSHRILNVHQNVPGVLRDINRIISDLNVNIKAQVRPLLSSTSNQSQRGIGVTAKSQSTRGWTAAQRERGTLCCHTACGGKEAQGALVWT